MTISYASRTLSQAEINYAIIEKELLAIVFCKKTFRPYLYERKFTLVTDHKPLVWLNGLKDPISRLGRWKIKLSEYDYEIKYKPGKINSNADALSRNPYDIAQQTINTLTFLENCDIDDFPIELEKMIESCFLMKSDNTHNECFLHDNDVVMCGINLPEVAVNNVLENGDPLETVNDCNCLDGVKLHEVVQPAGVAESVGVQDLIDNTNFENSIENWWYQMWGPTCLRGRDTLSNKSERYLASLVLESGDVVEINLVHV